MKAIKLLLVFSMVFASTACTVYLDDIDPSISLEEVLSEYDLWYVDYNKTSGDGDIIPFITKAFTISFVRGTMFANNNMVGIGSASNKLGIQIGRYTTYDTTLKSTHNFDGTYDFDVYQTQSSNEIELYDRYNDVSYFLVGYNTYDFDYDRLFYDNIEYFLQEYVAWEKNYTSPEGTVNSFDKENYLQFTSENNRTFYSSIDNFGTVIDIINWSFVGDYEIFDVLNRTDLKILTLDYPISGDHEEFELRVNSDRNIALYHIESGTSYEFTGKGFIQYLKPSKENSKKIERKRSIVKRSVKNI